MANLARRIKITLSWAILLAIITVVLYSQHRAYQEISRNKAMGVDDFQKNFQTYEALATCVMEHGPHSKPCMPYARSDDGYLATGYEKYIKLCGLNYEWKAVLIRKWVSGTEYKNYYRIPENTNGELMETLNTTPIWSSVTTKDGYTIVSLRKYWFLCSTKIKP